MDVDTLTGAILDARVGVAGLALLCYDFLLTFPAELRGIWWRKFSGATVVFLVIRYASLAYAVLDMVEMVACPYMCIPCSTQVCNILLKLEEATTALVLLGLASFCALRMYAISAGDYKTATLVFALITVDACLSVYVNDVFAYVPVSLPARECVKTVPTGLHGLRSNLDIVGTACSTLAELILAAVTWKKTAQVKRSLAQNNIKSPLIGLLLRNGIAGFSILSVCSIIAQAIPAAFGLESLLVPLLSAIVCRFMLSLRSVYLPSVHDENTVMSLVVGNLGAPLEVGREEGLAGWRYADEDENDDTDEVVASSSDLLRLPGDSPTISEVLRVPEP